MTSQVNKKAVDDINRLLKNINQSWRQGRWEQLEKCFHQDVVIAAPGIKGGGRGRKACVQSYRDFIGQADILDYRESDLTVDMWGDTATACYRFEISYRMNEQQYHDVGYDLFVFSRQAGEWLAVWRTIIPMAPPA
jgi:hypothetical protein